MKTAKGVICTKLTENERLSRRFVILGTMATLMSGCLGNAQPRVSAEAVSKQWSASDQNVEARIIGVQEAADGWLEYLVEGRNKSNKQLTSLYGVLIDVDGGEHRAARSMNDFDDTSLVDQTAISLALGVAQSFIPIPGLGYALGIAQNVAAVSAHDESINRINSPLAARFDQSLQGTFLSPRKRGRGSLFFPAVAPREIRISYIVDGATKTISLRPK